VLRAEVFQQLGLGGAAPPLTPGATGAEEHRACKGRGGSWGWGPSGDSGLCWGCVVDLWPPTRGRAAGNGLVGVGVWTAPTVFVGEGKSGGTPWVVIILYTEEIYNTTNKYARKKALVPEHIYEPNV
jgi:hypothetical protein